MKKFDNISDIDTDTDTGKMFFASMAVLSGSNFNDDDTLYGRVCNKQTAIDEIIRIGNYAYFETMGISGEINPFIDESLPEGQLLLTVINILTSEQCKDGSYGGHAHVNNILVCVFESMQKEKRNRQIDLIV